MTTRELVPATEATASAGENASPDFGGVFLKWLLLTFGSFLREQYPEAWSAAAAANVARAQPAVDVEATTAARLLGVNLNASTDEIRAALRTKITAGRIHPDAGGDADQARRLIDAKNLLIERARTVQR